MEILNNATAELKSIEKHELKMVEGGYYSTVDTTGMPDRAVGGCGTMWLLSRFPKSFSGRA